MARLGMAGIAFVVIVAAVGCGADSDSGSQPRALELLTARTPRFPVPRYDTNGTIPQVSYERVDLRAVNAALRAAVVADQRAYAPYARRDKSKAPQYEARGVYRTAVDPALSSASSAVVSSLLQLTREAFPGQHNGDGWLGITVLVPSGKRMAITDLFADPERGIRAVATAWKDRIRHTDGAPCLRSYPELYTATAEHYRNFALTPRGLAIGSWELEACYRLVAVVRYDVLRPYLNKLGESLVAGVRRSRCG